MFATVRAPTRKTLKNHLLLSLMCLLPTLACNAGQGDQVEDDLPPLPPLSPLCPAADDPGVSYSSTDAEVCAGDEHTCEANQLTFESDECGCGCIDGPAFPACGAADSVLRADSEELDFFYQTVGTQCPFGLTQSVTISNSSDRSVTIDEVQIEPSHFRLISPTGVSEIPAGSSQDFTIRFDADQIRPFRGQLCLVDDDGNGVAVGLSGIGTTYSVTYTEPREVLFDPQPIGTSSAPVTATISQSDGASEAGTLSWLKPTPQTIFEVQPEPGAVDWEACSQLELKLTFHPEEEGLIEGRLLYEISAGGFLAVAVIELAGVGD